MTMKEVDYAEKRIYEALGAEEMLLSMIKALSYDTKADIYQYIARCWEINIKQEDEDDDGE